MMALIFKCKHFATVLFLILLTAIQINCDSQEGNGVDVELIPSLLKTILTDEAAEYNVPLDIQKNYVYYISGFDYDNRPVWVVEAGKWDIRGMIEGGDEKYQIFDSFIKQAVYRIINSTRIKSTDDEPVDQVVIIVDLENFAVKQISSPATVSYILSAVRKFLPAFVRLNAAYLVNTNYVAETLINAVRPILGRDFERLEVYGNTKAKWIPQILKKIPRDQIPEWYGGAKDFTPYKVFG